MTSSEPETQEQPSPEHAKRIFLYLQLQSIRNTPTSIGKLELELTQSKNTLRKLEDHFTTNTSIDLSQFPEYKPTFSIMIEQDNVEDINILSDNPLVITICERIIMNLKGSDSKDNVSTEVDEPTGRSASTDRTQITQRSKPSVIIEPTDPTEPTQSNKPTESLQSAEAGESEMSKQQFEEYLNPLGQGHIDLIRFFTKRRELSRVSCFIYPLVKDFNRTTYDSACITEWEVYSLFPLLKEIDFCNMVYLSMESIFNAKQEHTDFAENIVLTVSFQSNIPNQDNQYEKVEICSFSNFSTYIFDKINKASLHFTWETMNSMELDNYECLGIRCGTTINVHKMFSKLVLPEDCDIDVKDPEYLIRPIISCNSTHRYVLTENLARILEDVLAFNEQKMVIELYHNEHPDEILMQGTIDLSIFLYPKVNTARFLVKLVPPTQKQVKPKVISSKNQSATKDIKENIRHTFTIISICLLNPLTEFPMAIISKNAKKLLKNVRIPPIILRKQAVACAENYKSFNDSIREVINYIIKHEISSIDDAKKVLCCQKENITNKILKLISCDFNVRFPTSNSNEFHNLMTIVYNELVSRVYDILKSYDDNMSGQLPITAEIEPHVVHLLSAAKYLDEVGDETLAELLRDKATIMDKTMSSLDFFTLVHNLEKLNYDEAKLYFNKSASERLKPENILGIIEIYIQYVEKLANEETFNAGLEFLIDALQTYLNVNVQEIAVWALLHCIFKQCGYLPGINYTRWKLGSLSENDIKLPLIPNSRWEIYSPYKFQLQPSERNRIFFKSFKMMIRLGLYKFAAIIFQELGNECTAFEKYMVDTTFKIILNTMPEKNPAKYFPTTKGKSLEETTYEKAFQANTNGHLEYYRGNFDAALSHYESILHIEGISSFHFFSLGLLRYAYKMLEYERYREAENAFIKCCSHSAIKLAAHFGVGKVMYKLNLLDDAENYFSQCTTFAVHVPDVWGYLSLINIRKKMNLKALECWKYAKLNQKFDVSEDVVQKLNEINYDELSLIIDEPVQTI